MRQSKRFRFPNGRGNVLAGIADIPPEDAWAWAIFSHCFTCTKDLKAIVRISRRLAGHGIGVLRYDATGLGDSDGDFSETNFNTTCQDVLAAAEFAAKEFDSPQILIGHSFGGAASLATASEIPTLNALVTIAAPSDTHHLAEHIARQNSRIDSDGEGVFSVGGQTYLLKRQLLQNLREFDLRSKLSRLRLPLLIFHSPLDETLAWDHAIGLFENAGGANTLVTLDGADHLLVNQPSDVAFVADMIATWVSRYIPRHGASN